MRPDSTQPRATRFVGCCDVNTPPANNTTRSVLPTNARLDAVAVDFVDASHAHAYKPVSPRDPCTGDDKSMRAAPDEPSGSARDTATYANRSRNATSTTGSVVDTVNGPYDTEPCVPITPTRTPAVVPNTTYDPR